MDEGTVLSVEEKQAIMAGTFKGKEDSTEKKVEDTSKETKTDTAKETKADTKVEERIDEKVGEKTEKKVEEKVEEKKVEESVFDLTAFNKKFGKEFESEDNFKSLFEKADKYDETKTSNDDLTQKLAEYQNLAEQLDPMSNFLNEDEYKRQQLLIKLKDELTDDAAKALSVLSPEKIKGLSDFDALRNELMLDRGVTREAADALLLKQYEIADFTTDDMDLGTKTMIEVAAQDARKLLTSKFDGIDVPTKVDYETARTQIKESWNTPLKQIVDGIDKIQLEDGVDFVVTDEMKEGLYDRTINGLMAKQVKPSEDAGANISAAMKDQLLLDNMGKVVKSIFADAREQVKSETRKEVHNDQPLKDTSRSEATDQTNDEKMKSML